MYPATAISVPAGLKLAQQTGQERSSTLASRCPVAGSHSRRWSFLSVYGVLLTVASREPSGEKAGASIHSAGPLSSERKFAPLAASQSATVLWSLTVARM